MIRSLLSLVVAAVCVRLAVAQQSGWIPNEVNTTMCYWQNPRAGVIRDTLYLDGGYLWWNPGLADGSYAGPQADGNPLGLVYLLNFSIPFNTSQNISAILTTVSKASGGSGDANNIGPQYVDGTMFANDFEWFTYGGLLADTAAYENPDAQSVATYEQYPSNSQKQFAPGYILNDLPSGMNRYVTYGAGVSVPSENLGFYFGGLRSSSWGEIILDPGPSNESVNADVNSLTLIELDMTVQQHEVWSNSSLPTTVPGRASAEIAWIPISEQGVLVAIGGVIDPAYANVNQTNNASVNTASETASPAFMSTVSVYDIANKVWYEQATSGQVPPQMAEGCTVVASAADGSSHNIYWYGGFDGLHQSGDYYDDVWILSVPSFMWMKFMSGNTSHARAGHRCAKPYPDQMFIVGGQASLSGPEPTCVEGSIVQIFNLSSGDWLQSYNPKVWSNYTVPDMIVNMIGGSGTGGATQAAPSPTGFADPNLNSLFKQSYNASKITTWYPYQSATTSPTTRPVLPTPVSKSSTPSYLAPVLGVVLGLFFITLAILAILLYRRRKLLKLNNGTNPSEAGTMDNRFWVSNWLRATPADAKAPTFTTDETPMTPYEDEHPYMQEVGGTQVHEMMDTSRPVELHDTGLVPVPLGGANRSGLASSPSVTSQTSQASTVSRVSNNSLTRPPISPMQHARADSPSLGGLPENMRIASGVSNVSETDRGHLRGISETSVSTDGNYATPMEQGIPLSGLAPHIGKVVSPLAPPHSTNEARDYLGAAEAGPSSPTPSQRRKSNFAEGLDEVRR